MFIYGFDPQLTTYWEVRIVENGEEKTLAKCNDRKSCYIQMTAFLKSLGCENILYNTHPVDNYIHVTSGKYIFHLYEIKKENLK